jgi:hypothetical protein
MNIVATSLARLVTSRSHDPIGQGRQQGITLSDGYYVLVYADTRDHARRSGRERA